MVRTNSSVRSTVLAILTSAFLVLFFTLTSLYVSPSESQIGKFRASNTIPEHLVILAGFGLFLGILSSLVYRHLDLKLAALIPIFVIIIDLDHLPSALGIPQPIRPAHSIVFLLVAFPVVFALVRRLDLPFALASGYFAHSGVDTGLFPPFSPFIFDYYTVTDYRWVFLALAVASSLIAGYFAKREAGNGGARQSTIPPEPNPKPMNVSFTRLIYYLHSAKRSTSQWHLRHLWPLLRR